MTSIRYLSDGVFLEQGGLHRSDVEQLGPKLEAARDEVLADARLWRDGGQIPADRQPLDAGFTELPERLLRENAELEQLNSTADRLTAAVDRVVVLGIGGSYMGARALMEACCHPFHNQVPRDHRGGRPQMYFEGNNVDNDGVQALIDLLGGGISTGSFADRWALVVISKSGGTLETAAALRIFLNLLKTSVGGHQEELARLVVPITGTSGKLFDLAQAVGCPDIFGVPDGVGGRFSVFSAVGLLPAAIMGLDIRRLLQGAAAMNDHFRSAAPGENVVLDYVGVCHALETQQGCDVRILSTWGKRLEAFGLWYDQLLAESLGKEERGALPLTVVNTRDLHSRGQQHQEGARDKLITNLVVDRPSTDPLPIGRSDFNQDGLNELADKTLPEILAAALAGTNQAYRDDNRPTADIRVPQLDEHVMGQLLQMMMLATAVEGRLIGINPYGQPGVEAYKKNMNAILRG